MSNVVLINKLSSLIKPLVEKLNYDLYHIEYVNEEGENYLRVYIDNEEGISFKDCEAVSRPLSEILDIEDPITDQYYLEVSSPGMFRELFTEIHYNKYIGSRVLIQLSSLLDGNKKFEGILLGFNEKDVNIFIDGKEKQIPRDKILSISLNEEFEGGN